MKRFKFLIITLMMLISVFALSSCTNLNYDLSDEQIDKIKQTYYDEHCGEYDDYGEYQFELINFIKNLGVFNNYVVFEMKDNNYNYTTDIVEVYINDAYMGKHTSGVKFMVYDSENNIVFSLETACKNNLISKAQLKIVAAAARK